MDIKQNLAKYQNSFFYKILEKELAGAGRVLDVGCGNNSYLGHIKKTFYSEGIDIYKKNLVISKQKGYHDAYKLGNVIELSKFYKPKSFDVTIAIDVIEHVTKEDAYKVISQMERIAKNKVILLTPNGYCEQGAYDGNPYQVHKSGWIKQDLQDLGYSVKGLRGLKMLRDEHAGIKYRPWIFWGGCAAVTEIILYPLAELSFDLFAVKCLT